MSSVLDTRPPKVQRTNAGVAELVAGFLAEHSMRVRTEGPDSRMRYLVGPVGEKPRRSFRTVRELAIAIELEVAGGV